MILSMFQNNQEYIFFFPPKIESKGEGGEDIKFWDLSAVGSKMGKEEAVAVQNFNEKFSLQVIKRTFFIICISHLNY